MTMIPSKTRKVWLTTVRLSGDGLGLFDLVSIARGNAQVVLDDAAMLKVQAARDCIEKRLQTNDVFYGINTGFGFLSDVHISKDKLEALQLNLIRSHACGVGDPLAADEARAILTLRIQTMMRGNSGVRTETIRLMVEFLNRNIIPFIPCKGSVGASGDLAPLAHVAMNLIGEGYVFYKGQKTPAAQAFAKEGLSPLKPQAKEGLCLINGTQVMTAIGMLACFDAEQILATADIATAMTVEAIKGTPTAFRAEIQNVRPHLGQQQSAQNLRTLLTASEIRDSHKDCDKVQDPYSLRCAPQVHGAARNAFKHVLETLLIEANSSTDNPLVFPETNEILSGGNFHGEPVAMVLDYLAIALSEIASIAERRVDKMVNPHMSGLPAFLAYDSGLNSGYMIPHVVTAALVAENKVLSHPASVDSLPTSADKEDHVSMGMTSAMKLKTIVKNVVHTLAIELITAAEGIEFHAPLKPGKGIQAAHEFIRSFCPSMKVDRSLSEDFERLAIDILSSEFVAAVESKLGTKLL